MTNLFRKIMAMRYQIGLLLLLVAAYFAVRLPHLTWQPIFADEAIYIRWAQIMRAEPTLRFISVTDGKTPLFMWILVPFFKFFSDPLLAGRLLSVLSGFLTVLGVGAISLKFFNRATAFWAMVLVIVTPYVIFLDRMAFVDSLLAAFSIWSLFFALLLIKYPRWDLAMVLGYLLGGGLLTKTPAMFNLLTLPTTIILVNFRTIFSKKIIRIIGLWSVTAVIAYAIYSILRLGPGFGNLNSRDNDYIFSPAKLIATPFDPFIPHLRDVAEWWWDLLGLPAMVAVLVGMVLPFFQKNRVAIVVLLWGLIPMTIEMAILQTFTTRYLLFPLIPLLLLAGWVISLAIENVTKFKLLVKASVLILVLLWPALFIYYLNTDLSKLPLPTNERRGYLQDWTAGYGLSEIADYLIEKSGSGQVIVGTEGNFGTLPDGLQIYLDRHSHLVGPDHQISVIPGKSGISDQLKAAAHDHQTFYVANLSRFPESYPGLTLVKKFPKIVGPDLAPDAILLFQINP